MDLAQARMNMVDSQIRPNKVYDRRLLDAMRRVPRELFLPPQRQAWAYTDSEVPLGGGRAMLPPMALARLIESAELRPGGHALVLGAGYAAALLAQCGQQVSVVEQDAAVLALAAAGLASWAPGVRVEHAPFASGWAAGAPYDTILIDGGAEFLPPALAHQLRETPAGRLLAVLAGEGRSGGSRSGEGRSGEGKAGAAVVAEAAGGGFATRVMFDCMATPIPQLRAAPAFVF